MECTTGSTGCPDCDPCRETFRTLSLWWDAGGYGGSVVYWGLSFLYRTLMLSTCSGDNSSADNRERPGKGPYCKGKNGEGKHERDRVLLYIHQRYRRDRQTATAWHTGGNKEHTYCQRHTADEYGPGGR